MKNNSITALKQLFNEEELDENIIDELRLDERKGVQQLVRKYDKKIQEKQALKKQFEEMCAYERRAYSKGIQYIAGVDEAGRGPLAGPVVAAAVILPEDFKLLGLNDSKQLTKAQKNKFYDLIKENAVSYGISIIDNQQIDELNIFEATKLAMKKSILQLDPSPEHVLIDAVQLSDLPYTSEAIIKGDSLSVSIAAASVLAKVTRDRIMNTIHQEFPMYDFQSNMGYGTKHHLDNLTKHGASPYHRQSFAPVRKVTNG